MDEDFHPMPDHWIDELARSKKTVERGAPPSPSQPSAPAPASTQPATPTPVQPLETPAPKPTPPLQLQPFTYSFNSDFLPGARLRASSDKKALHAPTNNPARRATLNSTHATPFRLPSDSTRLPTPSTAPAPVVQPLLPPRRLDLLRRHVRLLLGWVLASSSISTMRISMK